MALRAGARGGERGLAVIESLQAEFRLGGEGAGVLRRLEGMKSSRLVGVLCVAIVAAVAGTDFFTDNINLSILYALPIALLAQRKRPAVIWKWALLLALLTFAGYFIGPWPADTPTLKQMLLRYRLVNRGISAASLLAIAGLSHFGLVLQRRMDDRWWVGGRKSTDSERELYVEVMRSFEQFRAAVATMAVMVAIVAADLVSPGQINPPILYTLPVLICARANSRRFLWLTVVLAALLTWVGYMWGPPPEVSASIVPNLHRNRWMTVCVIGLLGLSMHAWIGRERRAVKRGRERVAYAGSPRAPLEE